MAQKTAAKTAVKPAAKKATAKQTTTKKTTKPAVKETKVAAPMTTSHNCGCDQNCSCAGRCGCCCGSKLGRAVRKLIVVLVIFALGFAAAKMCCCGKPGMRGPRTQAHFVNGCLDSTSIKCPKLLEALPAMDINQDGCITRDEYKAVKKQMRREVREIQVEVVDAE